MLQTIQMKRLSLGKGPRGILLFEVSTSSFPLNKLSYKQIVAMGIAMAKNAVFRNCLNFSFASQIPVKTERELLKQCLRKVKSVKLEIASF